jgi:hypothetical protein
MEQYSNTECKDGVIDGLLTARERVGEQIRISEGGAQVNDGRRRFARQPSAQTPFFTLERELKAGHSSYTKHFSGLELETSCSPIPLHLSLLL